MHVDFNTYPKWELSYIYENILYTSFTSALGKIFFPVNILCYVEEVQVLEALKVIE